MTENRNFNSQSQVPITCCQKIWTSGQVGNNGMVNSGLVNPGQSSFDGQVFLHIFIFTFKRVTTVKLRIRVR